MTGKSTLTTWSPSLIARQLPFSSTILPTLAGLSLTKSIWRTSWKLQKSTACQSLLMKFMSISSSTDLKRFTNQSLSWAKMYPSWAVVVWQNVSWCQDGGLAGSQFMIATTFSKTREFAKAFIVLVRYYFWKSLVYYPSDFAIMLCFQFIRGLLAPTPLFKELCPPFWKRRQSRSSTTHWKSLNATQNLPLISCLKSLDWDRSCHQAPCTWWSALTPLAFPTRLATILKSFKPWLPSRAFFAFPANVSTSPTFSELSWPCRKT